MYKTIRHGENSLQYTILPQNDDFRIEGKLAGNGNRLAGNASSSSSSSTTTTAASTSSTSAMSAAAAGAAASNGGHKRSSGAPRKRRTFFAYLGLIFVCTVIIGAVLIPFLVSAECLPSPTEWFLKTKAAFTHSGVRQQHIAPTAATVVLAVPATSLAAAMLGQNVGKTVQIVNRNGVEQFVLKVNKTLPSSTTTTTTTTTAATTTTTTTTTTTAATTTSTTAAPTIVVVPATEAVASTLPPPPPPPPPVATVATYAPPLSNRLIPATITTRIIQVPLLKSMAKKPIMPPVLAKSNTQQQQQESSNNKSNNNNGNNNWMNTHWAYIDPSTYVQWSGYKAEDSVLLPALLGFALIGMILIITVCLVARNKRTIVSSVRKRNRNPTTPATTVKMAIKPGLGRKTSNKNPPILSHEFVIQNHADIISCVAMVFVVGLMNESTAAFASAFISLHHNVSGEEASREQPNGKPYTYVAGIKDYCAIFFYTLTCIIMHAIIQEFLLDKISKKLHLSKFKLSRFNESGQLVAFYLISFVWGAQIVLREGYLSQVSQLWEGYPAHPMSFLHKFYFIIQLSYYLHMLPELYFQKIKAKEEQQPKIIHSISGFTLIVLAYTLSFQRLALVLLTLHYFSELLVHIFQLIGVFDREERLARVGVVNSACFVLVRFATSVIGVLTLYYGIGGSTDGGSSYKLRALVVLVGLIALQGYLVFSFITEQLRAKREAKREAKLLAAQTKKVKAPNKDKVKRKKESDLPEADQTSPSPVKQKLK